MKKTITILLAGIMFLSPIKAEARTIVVPLSKVTRQYLRQHKSDTIYAYVKGKRVKANGDGIDTDGYFIKYRKGKVGVKFTSIFRYANGTTETDDIVDRIDYKGWSTPR